jgi:hypothetical protein
VKNVPLIVIPDVQGEISLLRRLLTYLDSRGLLSSHRLALLGDYLDRGENPRATLQFVMELVADGAVAIRGNHEDVPLKAILAMYAGDEVALDYWLFRWMRMQDNTLWSYGLSHEGKSRIKTLQLFEERLQLAGHLDFLFSLPLYAQSGNIVLTHAGVLPHVPWHMQRAKLDKAFNQLEADDPPQVYSPELAKMTNHSLTGMQVVSGHAARNAPYVSPERVLLDCGAGYPGRPLVAWVSDTNQVVMVYPDGSISSIDPD